MVPMTTAVGQTTAGGEGTAWVVYIRSGIEYFSGRREPRGASPRTHSPSSLRRRIAYVIRINMLCTAWERGTRRQGVCVWGGGAVSYVIASWGGMFQRVEKNPGLLTFKKKNELEERAA